MKKFKIIEEGRGLSTFKTGLLSNDDSSKINGTGCLGYSVIRCDCDGVFHLSTSCTIKGACGTNGIGCIGYSIG